MGGVGGRYIKGSCKMGTHGGCGWKIYNRDHVRWVLMGGVGGRYIKGSCKMGTHGGCGWKIYKGIM